MLLLAALPLRGYAALAAALCETHHGGAPAAHLAVHDHDSDHEHGLHEDDQEGSASASICSMCAGCCVGAFFAPDSVHPTLVDARSAERILFLGTWVAAQVPEHRDRPPLAL